MAPNSDSPKHEEGTLSVKGRVPGRVVGERKIISMGPYSNSFWWKGLPRDQSGDHINFMAWLLASWRGIDKGIREPSLFRARVVMRLMRPSPQCLNVRVTRVARCQSSEFRTVDFAPNLRHMSQRVLKPLKSTCHGPGYDDLGLAYRQKKNIRNLKKHTYVFSESCQQKKTLASSNET